MSEYTILWLLLIGQFFAVEGQALVNKNYKGTLTAHLRKWASFEGKGNWWRARRIAWISFMAWMLVHVAFPGFI